MKTKLIVLLLLLLPLLDTQGQEITGIVLDNQKEPAMTAKVRLTRGQLAIAETTTDFDGWYSFKPLDTGTYNVTVSSRGLKTFTYADVPVTQLIGPR